HCGQNCGGQDRVVGRRYRAQVEQAAVVLYPPDDWGPAGPQHGGERGGHADRGTRQADARRRPPAAHRHRRDCFGGHPALSPPTPPSRSVPESTDARRRSPSTGAFKKATTGGGGPASVASSAARVSLSTRRARADGWRRSRSTSSARPRISPAWGPPSSLSPLAVTRREPYHNARDESSSSGSRGTV